MTARPTTTQRGYGIEHQRLRRAIATQIERDGAVSCWRCGRPIVAGQRWHLGHDDADRSRYRGAECVACNCATATPGRATAARRRGGRGGQAGTRQPGQQPGRRRWTTTEQP